MIQRGCHLALCVLCFACAVVVHGQPLSSEEQTGLGLDVQENLILSLFEHVDEKHGAANGHKIPIAALLKWHKQSTLDSIKGTASEKLIKARAKADMEVVGETGWLKHLRAMDSDGDGYLTREEFIYSDHQVRVQRGEVLGEPASEVKWGDREL